MKKGTWNVIATDGNPTEDTTVEAVNGSGIKINLWYDGNQGYWKFPHTQTVVNFQLFIPVAWREINNV